MNGIRTGLDFSKHELLITSQEALLVHHLKKPNSINDNIKFINTNDILAVTGDYGNWIFCREFHPSAEGGVSWEYWAEKLTYASCQEPFEYDAEETEKDIKEQLNGGLEEYGYKDKRLQEMKEYFEQSLNYVNDEYEYINQARQYPSFCDSETMIIRKKPKVWLSYIFDGFDEICRRIKEGEPTIETASTTITANEKHIELLQRAVKQLANLKPLIATDNESDMEAYNLIHEIKSAIK